MASMRHLLVLAALLACAAGSSAQAPGVLHIGVTVLDAAQTPSPVPRHALLISDNPATREPRRILTGADGTVKVTLPPGSYTVESDRAFVFLGQAYQWTQMVDVMAGRDTALELTAANAEIVPFTESPGTSPATTGGDPALTASRWQQSIVAVWSPTARASGFLIDGRGLIATYRTAIGDGTSVAVQLPSGVKVRARVLLSDAIREVAILWIDPTAVGTIAPVPLACPPTSASSLDEGQEVVTLAAALRAPVGPVSGAVTTLQPRAVETDLRLAFGGAGGPVFNESGAVVGLTLVAKDGDAGQRGEVRVVRLGFICEAVTAAQAKMRDVAPPEPARLPTEPVRTYPALTSQESPRGTGGSTTPPAAASSAFDVTFITPAMVSRAQQRADWTGGRTGRSPEAEARIGMLTDFGAWTEYFADAPAVLVVRVTPKLVEGFWKRLGREAARTQGAVLPAFKDFKADFLRMRATCGDAEVTPIHPFVLEHQLSEKDVVREGLYVFAPEAFGPQCGSVTLALYSEQAPAKADTLTLDSALIDRIWQDFARSRDTK
jgi:S1-C subfamily serine protease